MPQPRLPYWHRLVGLFFLGWVLTYANRTVLSPVLGLIGAEWRMSRTQLGLMNSIFFLTYTLVQVPAGFLADRVGRKRVLVPGFVAHALGAAASGLAPAAGVFLWLRAFTGLAQGTYYSTQYAVASAAVPARYRALGSSLINSGMAGGIGLGLLGSGYLVFGAGWDWRAPIVLLGAVTVVVALAMAWVVAPDRRRPGADHGQETGEAPAAAAPVAPSALAVAPTADPDPGHAAGRRTLPLTALCGLCSMYGFYVVLTWLPYFLQVRGFGGTASGNISALMALAAVPAGIAAALVSDRMGKRRPVILMLGPIAALSLVGMVASRGAGLLILAVVGYGLTGKLVFDPLLVSIVADATPRHHYAAAFSILNFASTVSMVLAPAVTGFLADRLGGFSSAFYLAAGIQMAGWLAMLAVRENGRPSA